MTRTASSSHPPAADLKIPRQAAVPRARQPAAAAAFGVRALATGDVGALIGDAVEVIAETLEVELAGMMEVIEPGVFQFRHGIGWQDGVVGTIMRSQPGSAVEYLLACDEPVIYPDLRNEHRFTPPRVLLDHGVISGMGVIVRGRTGVLGVLGAHARYSRRFTVEDADFLQTIANVLSEAMERAHVEAELRAREERFLRLAENAHDIIYRYRLLPTPGFEFVNRAIERVTGYTPADCYARPELAHEMIHPDDRAGLLAVAPAPADAATLVRYVGVDGRIVWCELRTVPVYDDSGLLIAVEGIARDVTERKRAEDRVRLAYEREHAAAEQLRALDSMKNAFLQAVSHELRTPLAAVLGMAITLEQRIEDLGVADRTMLVSRLAANARSLDEMLTDLLDLDRLMRRTIEPMRRPTVLLRLARDIATAADTGRRIVHVDGDDVVANVDTPKVARILENLLANAARHTPADASIWVRVTATPAGPLLVVEDDGPGIPDDIKQAIFEPFRGGPSASGHTPGTGIGLSLVAKFAELHGGRAWAEDRPGGGASIHVLLPEPEATAQPAPTS